MVGANSSLARQTTNKFTINVVYGHMRPNYITEVHRGNISILWSQLPIDGCDHYAYHNAFSYRGKLPGLNILIMLEPVVVLPGEFDHSVWSHFDHILTLSDALIGEDGKFHKIFFPRADGVPREPVTEIYRQRQALYPLSGRKNAICMISGNKRSHVPGELYSKRIEVAEWFNKNSKTPFDVYGRPPFQLPNYRGEIPAGQKISVLKQYRFSLCFENTNHPVLSAGYITEKILDCFETRTIPIYLGASNIEQYIPADCFIDFRNFAGLGELDRYLQGLSQTEYDRYISAIDTWVVSGNLRKYSMMPLNDLLAEICSKASSKSLESLFAGEKGWIEGRAEPPTARNWKFITSPVMWTWKHLSMAAPPVIRDGRIISTLPDPGAVGSDSGEHKSFSAGKKPLLKVLFAGGKFFQGNARKGYNYEWWNIVDALRRFENIQVQFFDCDTEAQQRGVAGMSEQLIDVVLKEKPDLLLCIPSAPDSGLLHEAMSSITAHTDTQTLIWMSDDHGPFENNGELWAPCVDNIVTTSMETAGKYQKAGYGQKVIKSQWGFNPFTYAPMPFARTRDVSFVGSAGNKRPEIIKQMRQGGLLVDAFGSGWSEEIMNISFQGMVALFSQTKVNLNIGDSFSALQQIKRRNFEVPGCRGFLLTTPADGLQECYEPDKEAVIASSQEEMIDKTRYYLAHEREREIIAQRGYERTLAHHTWTHRFVDIFKHIGFTAVPLPLPQVTPSPFFSIPSSETPGQAASVATSCVLTSGMSCLNIVASIIVMAYNQLQYTKQCLESILHYTTGLYELILVDNGSTDGTSKYFEAVRKYHPHTRVIKNFHNRIVEALMNYAASIAQGKYIVTVTNDTMVHENWLEHAIRQIESSPDIGMVGPRSNKISGPQAVQADYDTIESYQTFADEWSRHNLGTNFTVDRMVGMFTITSKAALERIGGWDPELPTNGRDGGYGFSDDDISLRLRLANYKLLVANDIFIHHFGSITASRYRPDLFGPAQNINMEKYRQKLLRDEHVKVEQNGEIKLRQYKSDEPIAIKEDTIVRSLKICIAIANAGDQNNKNSLSRYGSLKDSYSIEFAFPAQDSMRSWFMETTAKRDYDFIVLIDQKHLPAIETVRALMETAFLYPDVAMMVPVGNHAPSTHVSRSESGNNVDIIQYADLSFSVINVKHVRTCTQGLAHCQQDEEPFWFLQRRVRGEGYFIAKANDVVVHYEVPSVHHTYDTYTLPEQLVSEKKYAEATTIYKDDLRKDPKFVEALYQLACIAKAQHNISEAIQYAECSLEIDPHYIQSYIFLSRHFLEQGDIKRAENTVRLANLKQPGNPEVQEVVAEFELRKSTSSGTSVPKPKHSAIGTNIQLKQGIAGLVSIIIRVSQDLETVRKCLDSIREHTPEAHEIIIVSNGTKGNKVKWLQKQVKDNNNYTFLAIDKEASLASSSNEGIRASSGEHILLMTDDVIVTKDWLFGMVECLNSSTDIGIVGPMSNNITGPQKVLNIGYESLEDLDAFARSFREKNRHRRIPYRKIDCLCILLKRDLIDKIGPLDEGFDSADFAVNDYCLRAALEGHRNLIAGDVFIHHYGSLSSIWNQTSHGSAMIGDKKLFNEKWNSIDVNTPIGKKALTVKAIEKAQEHYHKEELDAAIQTLLEGIVYAPNEKAIYQCMTEMLIAGKRFKEAEDIINSMPEDIRKDARTLELASYCKEGMALYNEAEELADRILSISPNSAPALNLKGRLAFKKDDTKTAEILFKKAIESDPGLGEPYMGLGELKLAAGQKDEALTFMEKGFILSPAMPDMAILYYSSATDTGNIERAEQLFRDAKAIYPLNKRITFLLIDLLIRQGKNNAAMNEIEGALITFGIDDGILKAALEIREKVGTKRIEGTPKNSATLSLCMIVKNEEKYLAKCLMSIKPVVDEMVVVDTGSSDRTKEIAKAFGAEVYDFEWKDDFADARNFSLSKAKGDWIFILDADETISSIDHRLFSEIVKKRPLIPAAYLITTRNYIYSPNITGWVANDGTYSSEEAGTGWNPTDKVRLFPNDNRIRYEHPVHEMIESSLGRLGIKIMKSDIQVHHYGKLDTEKVTAKGKKYFVLGEKKLENNAGDAKSLFELAVQAGEIHDFQKAVELWQRLLNLNTPEAKVFHLLAYINIGSAYIGLGKFENAFEASIKALELDPNSESVVTNYALSVLWLGDAKKAIPILENLMLTRPDYPPAIGILSVAYLMEGKMEAGVEYLDKIKRIGYDGAAYLLEHANKLISAGRIDSAISLLEAAIESKNVNNDILSLLSECRKR